MPRLAEAEGVDVLFAPPPDEIYPDGFDATVSVGGLTDVLEGDPGQRGAGHFAGVTTVVTKLFNIVQPDVAYFGQKDAQQAMVIRKLVRDLDLPVRIEVVPDRPRRRRTRAELAQRLPVGGGPRAGPGPGPRPARGRAHAWRTARSPRPTCWRRRAPSSSGPASIPSTWSSAPPATCPR